MSARAGTRARIAIAVLVSAGLLFAFVFPIRGWWDQRRAIDGVTERVELLRTEADKLEAERDRLRSDAEVERLARARFNLVRPGETAWVVVPSPTTTTTPPTPTGPAATDPEVAPDAPE